MACKIVVTCTCLSCCAPGHANTCAPLHDAARDSCLQFCWSGCLVGALLSKGLTVCLPHPLLQCALPLWDVQPRPGGNPRPLLRGAGGGRCCDQPDDYPQARQGLPTDSWLSGVHCQKPGGRFHNAGTGLQVQQAVHVSKSDGLHGIARALKRTFSVTSK